MRLRPLAYWAFVPVALLAHLAGLSLLPPAQEGGPNGSGAGGDALVTLAAVQAPLEALIAEWERPPEVQPDSVAPQSPPPLPQPSAVSSTTTVAPQRPTLPEIALPQPDPPPAPLPKPVAPKPPPKTEAKPRPAPKTDAPAKSPPVKVPAQAGSRAAGSGGGTGAGAAGRSAEAALSAAETETALGTWKSKIQARIARATRKPRGLSQEVRVRVEIVISRSGALVSQRITQSSGLPEIDALCLEAVRRAAPFPPAPKGLRDAAYSFPAPFRFKR